MYAKQFLSKVKSSKNKPEDEYLFEKNKASMTGMVIGALLGVYVGYKRSYNLLVSTFIGGLAGSVATKILLKPSKKEK
jgi:gas vesicle protein